MTSTKEITLIVFDEKANFESATTQLRIGSLWRSVLPVESRLDFDHCYNELDEDDRFLLICHVFHASEGDQPALRGYMMLINSGIEEDYHIQAHLVSSGDSGEVMKELHDTEKVSKPVHIYSSIRELVKIGSIQPYTKRKLTESMNTQQEGSGGYDRASYPQIDYAIITALYEDEFEELKKIFDFPLSERIKTGSKEFYIGYLKTDKSKKVVAAIQNATGMVDASIVATMLIEMFRPRYILMSGVCGGSQSTGLGDIIVAKQVFTFQKGKISDISQKASDGTLQSIELYDSNRQLVDHNRLYDKDGNQITISVEKFERENDSVINLNTVVEDALRSSLGNITRAINASIQDNHFFNDKQIKIVLEPMACSTMVINKEGYFDDTIKSIDRKTAAVEMESYGVARACQFANDGKTIFIIFKSVMDKTVNKVDHLAGINYKKFAAYTSAMFMQKLFDENIIN